MKKIDTSGWKSFKIDGLFELKRPATRSQIKYPEGNTPFVSSGNYNNGVVKYCEPYADEALDAGNCITVSPLDGSAFYQPNGFLGRGGAGSAIMLLYSDQLTKLSGLFIATIIRTSLTKYYYADQLNSQAILDEYIKLPSTEDGQPDWGFMELFMQDAMNESKACLDNFRLTKEEKTSVYSRQWKEMPITSVFDIANTKSIVQKDIVPDSGETPYVTASSENNGILTYITCPPAWIDKGNCIMIGGKTLTFTYQENDFCSNDSHNIALYVKDSEHATKLCYLFLIAALRASLRQKYSWGDSISKKRIKKDKVHLPMDFDGQPDWQYMESYMASILKDSNRSLNILKEGIA